MSSFETLRASRQKKESKSYVTSSSTPQNSSTVSFQPSTPSEGLEVAQLGHSSLPSNLEVRISSVSGRGLWTKSSYKPGDVIISVKPHIAAVSNQHLNSYCSNCFGPPTTESGLKRCTTCRTIWYCSSTCQASDWPLHKRECGALQEWSKSAPSPELSIPSDAIRCLGRMLWKMQKQKQKPDSSWVKEINNMQSHRTSLRSSSYELHTHLSHALVRYLGLSSPQELAEFGLSSPGDLVDVISRFVTNTFSISTPTLTPIGASISPPVALINHSCDPNAVVVFPRPSASTTQEPSMQVIALRSILAGEEILTSYIDTTLPKALRQQSLEETYCFSCQCKLCTDPPDIDPRESLECPKSCGGTCPLPKGDDSLPRCNKCKTVVKTSDAVLDAVRIGQEALDKATALEFKDPEKAKQLTANLIPILISTGLTPTSHPLLALTRLHQSLLVSSLPTPPIQESLDEIVRIATRASTGLSGILQYGHPVRGIALAELGKLLAVDEPNPRQAATAAEAALLYPPSGPARLKLAYDSLMRARQELLVGFGVKNEGGGVGREVREIIVGLEKEISVWKQGVRNVIEDMPGQAIKHA